MENTKIREMKVDDFKDVYLLNKELGYEYQEEKVKDRIKFILTNTKDVIFVMELKDKIIGYIHGSAYELLYSDSLINILGFVVKEAYRNIGIGNRLIQYLEDWASVKGYSGIRLSSGIHRLDAHKFYEKHGYINDKNQKRFIKLL